MRRASFEEKRQMVEEWQRSGLTATAFARRRGIHRETLMRWVRVLGVPKGRRPRRRAVARTVALVEVPRTGLFGGETRVEVTLRTGQRLTLFGEWTTKAVAELARALEVEE